MVVTAFFGGEGTAQLLRHWERVDKVYHSKVEAEPIDSEDTVVENANPVAVSVFNFENNTVRTVVDDSGTIWFVAKDVADALGYARPNDAISDHCKGAVNRRPLQTAGGIQDVRIINEPDVYALIFGSKLESAEKFKLWVFNEVLPTIRKTGKYEAPKVEPKIGSEEVNSVSARELYLDLGMFESNWSRWSKENIEENKFFTQDVDFTRNFTMKNPTNGVAIKDFIVTIEFAKHIAMMAKTQRAHDYRNYFIECEKVAKGEIPKVEPKQDGGLLDDMNTIDWLIKNSNTALNTWRTSYGQFVKN